MPWWVAKWRSAKKKGATDVPNPHGKQDGQGQDNRPAEFTSEAPRASTANHPRSGLQLESALKHSPYQRPKKFPPNKNKNANIYLVSTYVTEL